MLLYFQRRPDAAIAAYRKLLDAHPDFGPGRYFLGQSLAVQERYDEAVAELREAVRRTGGAPEAVATLGYALARSGQEAEATVLLEELRERSQRSYVSPVLVAHIHLGLRDNTRALEALRRAHEQRAADLVWLGVRPLFDPLREEPGYEDLLRQMKLT